MQNGAGNFRHIAMASMVWPTTSSRN